MVRRGFTLIELLVVITIIALLIGLTLAALPAVQAALKKKRSETTLVTVRIALETTAAAGTRLSAAPHPLAGTAAPRSLFYRSGAALAIIGEGLECDQLAWVDSPAQSRVVQPGDLFAGRTVAGDCPALFGIPRGRLAIIGAPTLLTRHHRRLPAPSPLTDINDDGIIDTPYTAVNYPDRLFLVSAGLTLTVTSPGAGYTVPMNVTLTGGGGSGARATAVLANGAVVGITLDSVGNGYTSDPNVEIKGSSGAGATAVAERYSDAASAVALQQVLGLAGRDEVMSSGAVFTTTGTTYLCDDLLWDSAETSPYWKPGFLQIGGVWRRYRIRGTALYDSYGTEILFSTTSTGAIRLESAGRDGLFRWKPSASGYSVGDLLGDPPPERDGSLDNISMVTGE